MASETLQPDGSVFALTNMTGVATDVDEGVDSPGGDWLALIDDANDCIVRASFPTPSGDPTTGAGLQRFRLYVRVGTAAGGNDPTMDVAIRETGGGSNLAVQTGISVTSHSGEVIEFTWDASVLGTADGSAVEIYVTGQRSGGGPSSRRCVEFDAIEWVADYSIGGTAYDETGLAVQVAAAVASTDVGSFTDSGTVTAVSAVSSVDVQSMVESTTIAIVAAVTGSDGLKFIETGGTVAASSTVAGTDSVTFTGSGTVAAVATVASTDVGSFTDSGVISISAIVAVTDVASLVESLAVAVVATVTGSDTHSTAGVDYDETGLTVQIAATSAGSDIAAFAESGVVAVTSAVSGSDAFMATDHCVVMVAATVAGFDGFGPQTMSESAVITVIATVIGSDVAVWVEALTVAITATVTGTDRFAVLWTDGSISAGAVGGEIAVVSVDGDVAV